MMVRAWLLAGGVLVGIGTMLLARNALVPTPLETLRYSDGQYTGSWLFPRGGPYVLGFYSRAPAELKIDGRVVARGSGTVSQRLVYPQPGVRAVAFSGPPDARLLWHPPGRRGPLEYVPASSLTALSPQEARFTSGSGASLVDGVIAAASVLLLVGPLLILALRRLRGSRTLFAASFVFVVALAVRGFGIGEQGQTWDEDTYWSAGKNYVTNMLDVDFSQSAWQWNFEHPPVSKYIYGIAAQFADGFEVARWMSACLGSMSCAFVFLIGASLFDRRVGLLAGVIAATCPHLVAHSQIVGHESVSLFWWSLAIWWALGVAHDQQRVVRGRTVFLGVMVGLAVSTRFVNGLLAPIVWITVVLRTTAGRRRRVAIETAAIVGVGALATLFLLWPALWHGPIDHLQAAWGKLRGLHALEPFAGEMTNRPPWHYFAVYAFFATPSLLWLGVLAFFVQLVRSPSRAGFVVAGAMVVPFVVSFSPVRQDGVRYVLVAFLAVSVAAAQGWVWLTRKCWPRHDKELGVAIVSMLLARLPVD